MKVSDGIHQMAERTDAECKNAIELSGSLREDMGNVSNASSNIRHSTSIIAKGLESSPATSPASPKTASGKSPLPTKPHD